MIDTNVLTGTLLTRTGHHRRVIQGCLEGRLKLLIGEGLFLEHEDMLGRTKRFALLRYLRRSGKSCSQLSTLTGCTAGWTSNRTRASFC